MFATTALQACVSPGCVGLGQGFSPCKLKCWKTGILDVVACHSCSLVNSGPPGKLSSLTFDGRGRLLTSSSLPSQQFGRSSVGWRKLLLWVLPLLLHRLIAFSRDQEPSWSYTSVSGSCFSEQMQSVEELTLQPPSASYHLKCWLLDS